MPLKPVDTGRSTGTRTSTSTTTQSASAESTTTSTATIDEEDVDTDEKERKAFGVVDSMAYVVYTDGTVDIGADGRAVRLPQEAMECILAGEPISPDIDDTDYAFTEGGGVRLIFESEEEGEETSSMEIPPELATRVSEEYESHIM